MNRSCQSISGTIAAFFAGQTAVSGEFFAALLPHAANIVAGDNPIRLLAELQLSGCAITDDDRTYLLKAVQTVELSLEQFKSGPVEADTINHHNTVRNILQLQHPDDAHRRLLIAQVHHRLLGLLYGILAASQLPRKEDLSASKDNDNWVSWLNQSGTHWDAAWRFPLAETMNGPVARNGLATLGRVDSALDHAWHQKWLQREAGNNWSLRGTTWLTVRRLLCFLLSETDQTFEREQLIPVLTVLRRDQAADDDNSAGHVRGMSLQLRSEGRSGWYFDPVAFGITVFDDDMQQSVELAGRLSWPSLKGTAVGAMRMTLAPYSGVVSCGPQRILLLSGNSAGGLTGCGLHALAHNVRLTEGLTATVGLRLKSSKSLTPGLQVTEQDVECVGVGGAVPKLTAAAKAGLKGVGIHPDNAADAKVFQRTAEASQFRPQATNTFSELYEYLTQGFEIEQVAAEHATECRQHWRSMLAGDSGGDFDHKLDTYVPPRLSVELRPAELRDRAGKQNRVEIRQDSFELLDNGVDDLVSRYIENEWSWLLISERAGGGKTVLSWHLLSLLSDGDTPYIVVRFEDHWPDNLRRTLEQKLATRCDPRGVAPATALDNLLKQRRVIVIFDALDQVRDSTAGMLQTLFNNPNDELLSHRFLRIVVTSRPTAIERWPDGFRRDIWRHFHLEDFNNQQQNEYLRQFAELRERLKPGDGQRARDAWAAVTGKQSGDTLLRLPNNLRNIRMIIEDHLDRHETLRAFQTTGDLAWELAYRNLSRDPFRGPAVRRESGIVSNLMRAAACLAYEVFRQTGTYFVQGEQIIEVKDYARLHSGMTETVWNKCDVLLSESLLHGSAVLRLNDQDELSFPSQKIMEFFVGVFLARYSNETSLQTLHPFLGNGQWENAWLYAIEMLETTDSMGKPIAKSEAYLPLMHVLFSLPQQHSRPTRLMFLAWLRMNRTGFSGLQVVLDQYRRQFLDILEGDDPERARLAAELWLEDDVIAHFSPRAALKAGAAETEEQRSTRQAPGREKLERLRPGISDILKRIRASGKHPDPHDLGQLAYSWCSDRAQHGIADRLTFLMGASPEDQDALEGEKPWQPVDLPAFFLATCCVTRGQYRLFDPQRELLHEESFKSTAQDDECPMIRIDFFDAFCFALILGDRYTLPSECEWEGAAWGGIDRQKHPDYVIGIPPFDASFTSQHVNFDGNHPLDGKKSEYRVRTLPVRHSAFDVNGFGLWQMHGNVREWCRSEIHAHLYELNDAVGHRNDDMTKTWAGSGRSLRGGSFCDKATGCRASGRDWIEADFQFDYGGFRLSRTK